MSDTRDDEIERALRELAPALEQLREPEAPDALFASTLRRASAELGRAPALAAGGVPADRRLPVGFRRELVRLVTATLPALALVIAWNALVLLRAPALLEAWLGPVVAWTAVGAYVLGALGWLALTYGALPVLAHRRALLRLREVT